MRSLGTNTDLTINNCIIDGGTVSGRMGYSGGQLEGDVTVTNCEFKDVYGWALLDSRSGSGGDGSAMDTVTFAHNDIHDCDGSIVFRGLSTDRTDVLNIYDNTWDNIGGNGNNQHWAAFEANRAQTLNVYDNTVNDVVMGAWGEGQAFQFWDIDTLDVHDNTVTNCYEGIWIYSGGTFAVPGGSIYCNEIYGNSQYGLSVDPTATGGPLDATCNWWGDCSGPSGKGPGSGDAVSTNVDFDPWTFNALADAGGPYVDDDCNADCTIVFDGSGSYGLTYSWDFGDSQTGTGINPTHTYGTFGEYTVTLTVSGSGCCGGASTVTDTATVKIYGVIADAGGPYSIAEDATDYTVEFDGSGSTGYETPLTYDWDFGDGSAHGTGVNPTHTYYKSGTYDVILTVTDASATCSDWDTTWVRITGDDPPILQLITPEDGETVDGIVNVKWYAIDDDYHGGVGIPIYLYYKPEYAGSDAWRQINGILTNNLDIEHGDYDWDTSGFSDGGYDLRAVTMDYQLNMYTDTHTITIANGNAGVMISDVSILDTTVDSTFFVKDGDNIEISAGITGNGVVDITLENITADLSGFGLGNSVVADSFDGFTATWMLTNVGCTPSDGPITVIVTIDSL